ncbi:hypothetical protein HRbin16_00428 [bacterium HR16]|nr:hypothetical protein HRbin16_00428 [bacterium HR16]
MAGDWRIVRLGDVVTINPDAIGPDWPFPHIKYVDISSVGEGLMLEPPKLMSLAEAPSRAKRLVRKGDTVLSTVRPNRRSMFFVSNPDPDLVVSTGFAVLRPKPGLIDPRYLYACVFDKAFTEYLVSREKGAAYPAVLPEDIADARINLPPLPEQRAIAHILGTLDDKIELNRRMSETLEAMARAIFKAWFVDFEPVRAKCRGARPCAPTGWQWPQHVLDLFPDRLVDSELGEIPEGWEVVTLGQLMELAYGRALKEDDRKQGRVPVYGSNGQVGWHNEALVDGPGIIVGRKGNPGIVTWVPTDFWAIDTTFYVVPKQKCRSLYFLFFALSGQSLPSLAADSAVPGLNRNFVYSNLQVIPPLAVLNAFDEAVKVLFDRRYLNERESRTLAALRDALLPKLISGELRVKDAERFLEEKEL